jgi:hypothetical protein
MGGPVEIAAAIRAGKIDLEDPRIRRLANLD